MLVKWGPKNDLSVFQREMGDFLDRVWGRRLSSPTGLGAFLPAADIRETKDSYIVELDLPGMEQKDITVGIEDDVLTVKGERKCEEEKKEGDMSVSERMFGSFIRSFSLPGTADGDKISAVYKKGELVITIPKKEEAKPKSVNIQVQ